MITLTLRYHNLTDLGVAACRDAWLEETRKYLTPEAIGHVVHQWKQGKIALIVKQSTYDKLYSTYKEKWG